jgi:hypothetical protein
VSLQVRTWTLECCVEILGGGGGSERCPPYKKPHDANARGVQEAHRCLNRTYLGGQETHSLSPWCDTF